MTINKTAYDTTPCRGMSAVLSKIADGIIKCHTSGMDVEPCPNFRLLQVVPGYGSSNLVPSFAHPLYIPPVRGLTEEALFVHDARQYSKRDRMQELVYNDRQEQRFVEIRSALQRVWLEHDVSLMRDMSALPIRVFKEVIVQSLVKRYALDVTASYRVGILAGLWWHSNFCESDKWGERDGVRVAQSISRNLFAKVEDVLEIMDMRNDMTIENTKDFCEGVREITQSQRLKDLDAGILYTVIGSSWYGINAKEIIAVAMEHPPTWLAILYLAIQERGMRNSGVAKVVEKVERGNSAMDFARALTMMIRSMGVTREN